MFIDTYSDFSHTHFVDHVIVGAGISGLTLAFEFLRKEIDFIILEKSKGLGGRLATRRIGENVFDHGLQFFKTMPNQEILAKWQNQNLISRSDHASKSPLYWSHAGMTSLAKVVVEQSSILPHCLVEKIEKVDEGWQVTGENFKPLQCKQIFLSCPLPQSRKILENSRIPYSDAIKDINYHCAIVGLLLPDAEATNTTELVLKNPSGEIRQVTSQNLKGLNSAQGIAIEMSAAWSEKHFEAEDTMVLDAMISELKKLRGFKTFTPKKESQVKKWRYAKPALVYPEPFYSPLPHLFLFGDSFGASVKADGDFERAVNSAMAVARYASRVSSKSESAL